ncbi:unnamed protein product, partial [Nesidiocoris tenuis]
MAEVRYPTVPSGYRASAYNPLMAALSILKAMLKRDVQQQSPSQVLARTVFFDESVTSEETALPEDFLDDLKRLDPYERKAMCHAVRFAMDRSKCKPRPFKREEPPQNLERTQENSENIEPCLDTETPTKSAHNRLKKKHVQQPPAAQKRKSDVELTPVVAQKKIQLKPIAKRKSSVETKPIVTKSRRLMQLSANQKRKIGSAPQSVAKPPSSKVTQQTALEERKVEADNVAEEWKRATVKTEALSPIVSPQKENSAALVFARHPDRWYYPAVMDCSVYHWDRTTEPVMIHYADGAAPPKAQIPTNILPLERLPTGSRIQLMDGEDEAIDAIFESYKLVPPTTPGGMISAEFDIRVDDSPRLGVPFKNVALAPLDVVELKKTMRDGFYPLQGRRNFTDVTSKLTLFTFHLSATVCAMIWSFWTPVLKVTVLKKDPKKDINLRDALSHGTHLSAITLLSPGWDIIKQRWVEPRNSKVSPLRGSRVVSLFQYTSHENFKLFWIALLRYVGATTANIPSRHQKESLCPIPLSGSKTSGSGTCSVTEQFETEQSVAPLVEPEATARPSGSGRIILSFDWLSDPTVTDVKKFRNPNFSPPCRTIVASWTVNEEIEITYAVQARPALWNVASREYKQAPLKALMWAEVDTRRLGSQLYIYVQYYKGI